MTINAGTDGRMTALRAEGTLSFSPTALYPIVSDFRLGEKEFEAFKWFPFGAVPVPLTTSILTEGEAYQFIRGWFSAQGLDHYPAVSLILRILKGAKWRILDAVGTGENRTFYIGVSEIEPAPPAEGQERGR